MDEEAITTMEKMPQKTKTNLLWLQYVVLLPLKYNEK
jgi:hypothetical protein